MKTTKILSAAILGFALLSTGISFAGRPAAGAGSSPSVTMPVRYQVNIHLTDERLPVNQYLVELVDPSGHPAVPSQVYRPGVSVYKFYEVGPIPVTGIRIARIVPNPDLGGKAGLPDLFCRPDIKSGSFQNGRSYSFDLYPHYVPSDKD